MLQNRKIILKDYIIFGLLFFLIFFIGNFSFYEFQTYIFNVKTWIRDSYLLNYFDYGFIKRGLIGTILGIRVSDVSIVRPDFLISDGLTIYINFFSVILISIIIVLYIFLMKKIFQSGRKLLVLLAISPFAFLNFGYDAGRYDQIGIIYFLLVCIFIDKKNILFFLVLLSPLFLLIQETNLFLISPFIFFYIYFFEKQKFLNLYLLSVNIIVLLFLFLFGDAEYTKDTYIWPFHAYFDASKTFFEKNLFWWQQLFNFKTTIIYRHFFAILIFLILNFYFIDRFKNYLHIKKFIFSVLFCFSPILILAIDHSRYVSNYIFILSIFLITIASKEKYFSKIKIPNYYYLVFFIGPFGVSYSLPYLTIFKKLLLSFI